jgi:type IV pilus assembly protein PilV
MLASNSRMNGRNIPPIGTGLRNPARPQNPTIGGTRFGLKGSAGFTLLETMVSFVILGVGLLGMAALQGTALRYSNQAYLRSQANIVAYDIFERMRANPAGVAGGYYAFEADEGEGVEEVEEGSETDCKSASCTPQQLATYDLDSWSQSIGQILPAGSGSLTNNGASSYTVTVSWIEQQKAQRVDEDASDDNDRALTITVTM